MLLLTQERKKRGLSMSALSRKAGMHVSSVSQIESGHLKPYGGQIIKIAKALDWSGEPEKLFDEVVE